MKTTNSFIKTVAEISHQDKVIVRRIKKMGGANQSKLKHILVTMQDDYTQRLIPQLKRAEKVSITTTLMNTVVQ